MLGSSQPSTTRPSQIRDYFPFRSSIRQAQEKALAAIERARDRGKKFVLLELPTGTGKSAVAFAAATWATTWGNGAYILSPQKALTAQYMRDFAEGGLVELRGRSSYRCEDFETDCEAGGSLRGKNETVCLRCPYKIAKDQFVSQEVGVTNFDYFLAETLYSGQLPKRSMLILDEAHNLEQKILGFTDFEISPFALQRYSVAIPWMEDGDLAGACEWIEKEMMPAVDNFVSNIGGEDPDTSEARREAESLLRRMRRFLGSDLQEWAYWNDQKKFIFRPLSAAKYAQEFLFSRAETIVIMSATILDFDVFCRTLGLSRTDCECLALPSDFLVDHRPILYCPAGSMKWQNKGTTLPKIAEELKRLLGVYPHKKGLIHTNSYPMNQYLVKALTAAGHGKRIITHAPGGAEGAIQRHRTEPGPTVLCSPAMTEGVDLPGDLSRFQVVVKVPYPNFKDPYVAARKRRDNSWYVWQTAMRLIQATGRSVRSETDFAETYILDEDFGDFRQRSRNLLPRWWLQAISEPAQKKRAVSATSTQADARERKLF